MNNKINLLLTEDRLTIAPSNEVVEKYLTINEKFLEQHPSRPWEQVVRYRKRKVFRVIKDKPRVIQTMQGFWYDLKTTLEKEGYNVRINDLRQKFPRPRYDLMFGFRYSQKELLVQFLQNGFSGLLGAPTRYGKTCLILNTIRAFSGVETVVVAPGADLIKQLYEAIQEACPDRESKLIGAGSRVRYPSEDITVCSMDSLDKCDTGRTRLLLIDEPHAAVTNSRLPIINSFRKARRLGYGATLTGRFDNRDALITGLIGPVWAERTYTEAVEEGAICPLVVLMLQIPIHKHHLTNVANNRRAAYRNIFFQSHRMASTISYISKEILPVQWQTIYFIKDEAQADFLLPYVGEEGSIAMAKKLTKNKREELMQQMRDNSVKRCLASEIYSQGVTFNHVRAMVNCAGGGANTSTIQKPGRLAEVLPNKRAGIVIDFQFVPAEIHLDQMGAAKMLVVDSQKRLQAYEEKGYKIVIVKSRGELKQAFNENAF